MLKISELRKFPDLDRHRRALATLKLGVELQTKRHRPPPPGRLPMALIRGPELGVARPILERLHGLPTGIPLGAPGLLELGTIRTVKGEMPHLLLRPGVRKSELRTALRQTENDTLESVAVRQLAVGLLDPDPMPRVCAAYAYWQATGATHVVVPILSKSLQSRDEEEFTLAAHAMAKVKPALLTKYAGASTPSGQATSKGRHGPRAQGPVQPSMTVLIHGTFAHDQEWYQPGGDFQTYIKQNVFPDLYGSDDFFRWSGRYSDRERRKAAKSLVEWCAAHPASILRLIGHSHGANVANIATTLGLATCTLIHLSPPVHEEYLPDMPQVSSGRFYNLHSRIDLVVFIDGGGQNYKRTTVETSEVEKICAFAGHAKSHGPDRWEAIKGGDLVRQACT